jgi:hypothetical protein
MCLKKRLLRLENDDDDDDDDAVYRALQSYLLKKRAIQKRNLSNKIMVQLPYMF